MRPWIFDALCISVIGMWVAGAGFSLVRERPIPTEIATPLSMLAGVAFTVQYMQWTRKRYDDEDDRRRRRRRR